MAKHLIANPLDLPTGKHSGHYRKENLYVFSFGAYGDTYIYVWEYSLEDGLEIAAGFLVDQGWKGFFTEPDYDDARKELGPDASEEAVQEQAETDLTYTESGYIASWEWFVRDADDKEFCIAYRKCAMEYEKQYYEEPEVPEWVKKKCQKVSKSVRWW